MEKIQFISEIKVGDLVESLFAVAQKQVRKKKNGEDYCTVTLQDKSGTVEGVLWTEAFLAADDFQEGDLVEIKGVLKEFRGARQLLVDSLKRTESGGDIDLTDYIKSTSKDIDQMFGEIMELIAGIKNKYLRQLLELFMDDKEFAEKYRTSTAAVRYHHAYKGDCWSTPSMWPGYARC